MTKATQEQIDHYSKIALENGGSVGQHVLPPFLSTPRPVLGPSLPTPKVKGKARKKVPGEMNQTERAWADELDKMLRAGLIVGYWYEMHKLKLADSTHYTPDFLVIFADGSMEFHEVKAMWRDGRAGFIEDARVKLKWAAKEYWPYQFVAKIGSKASKRHGGEWSWKEERFS